MSKNFQNKSLLNYLILNNGSSFLINTKNYTDTHFYIFSTKDCTNNIYTSSTLKTSDFQNKKKHIFNFRKSLF